jgi:hypothetical protein
MKLHEKPDVHQGSFHYSGTQKTLKFCDPFEKSSNHIVHRHALIFRLQDAHVEISHLNLTVCFFWVVVVVGSGSSGSHHQAMKRSTWIQER